MPPAMVGTEVKELPITSRILDGVVLGCALGEVDIEGTLLGRVLGLLDKEGR